MDTQAGSTEAKRRGVISLPTTKQKVFTAFSTAILMTLALSFVMILVLVGPKAFPMGWLRAWGLAFVVALPLTFVLPPTIRRVMGALRIE